MRLARRTCRMAQMVTVGVALLITGLILNPPRALLRRLHKEN